MSAVSAQSLFIRADAGGAAGTGHVMRMLALAQGWVNTGGWQETGERSQAAGNASSVVFICACLPEGLEKRLQDEGFEVVRIDTEPGSEADVRATLAVVRGQVSGDSCQEPEDSGQEAGGRKQTHIPSPNKHWLVTDGYHFDYTYQKAIKAAGVSLLCVDDHGYAERWCCDAILNQNLDAETTFRYDNDVPDAKYLLGSSYCLLRREFWRAPHERKPWQRIERLLVTLGGSDPANATGATLQLLDSACERPLTLRVLAGVDNPHLAQLQALESHHAIEVLTKVTDMPAQYAWADGIISAGGSTCWEWLHAGLPGAIVTIAANQLPIVQALTETRRAALPLGWYQEFAPDVQGPSLVAWLDAPETLVEQASAQAIIDGSGAARVLAALGEAPFFLRPASTADCKCVWGWMNDQTVRQMSFHSDLIPWETHYEWWHAKLSDARTYLQIAENGQLGAFGVIRFEGRGVDGEAVISVALSPKARGKGLGTQVIYQATLQFLNTSDFRKVFAYTKKENQASISAFQKAGYSLPEPAEIGTAQAYVLTFDLSNNS